MFLTSLENVALLLAMAIPGFIAAKAKLFKNDQAINVISILLLYICQPFVTFNSFLNTAFNPKILLNLTVVFIFTAALLVILVYIGKLIMRLIKNTETGGIYAYACSFGNIGYLCVPFLQILMPGNNEVLLYASTAIVAFNLVAWTVGNYVLTGDKSFIRVKRIIFNPPTVSFILVLPLFILNLNFLRFQELAGLAKVVGLFSNLVGPLAMTLVGIKFSEIKIKELFSDYKVYLSIGVKLIISPLIAFCGILILSTFYDVQAIRLNIIALAAMPTANNLMMFCSLYGKDTKTAAKIVLLSTILSVLTIPLALTLYLQP